VLYRSTHNAVIPTSSPLAWCIERPAEDGRSVWLDQHVLGALVGASPGGDVTLWNPHLRRVSSVSGAKLACACWDATHGQGVRHSECKWEQADRTERAGWRAGQLRHFFAHQAAVLDTRLVAGVSPEVQAALPLLEAFEIVDHHPPYGPSDYYVGSWWQPPDQREGEKPSRPAAPPARFARSAGRRGSPETTTLNAGREGGGLSL
ncbi:MAG: hypothetical protein ACRDX8_13220, partial [Acidimicrobiales bacterium]